MDFLKELTQKELDRAEEIRFFFYFAKLNKLFKQGGAYTLSDYIEMMAEISNTSALRLKSALNTMFTIAGKPKEIEIIISLKIIGMSNTNVIKNFVHNRRLYYFLEHYQETRHMLPLTPINQPEQVEEIKKFNTFFANEMSLVSEVMFLRLTQPKELDELKKWDY